MEVKQSEETVVQCLPPSWQSYIACSEASQAWHWVLITGVCVCRGLGAISFSHLSPPLLMLYALESPQDYIIRYCLHLGSPEMILHKEHSGNCKCGRRDQQKSREERQKKYKPVMDVLLCWLSLDPLLLDHSGILGGGRSRGHVQCIYLLILISYGLSYCGITTSAIQHFCLS